MLLKTRYFFFEILGILVTLLVVAFLGVSIALSQGPIPLKYINSILNIIIEKSLKFDDVHVKQLELLYDNERGGLYIEGVQIALFDGATHYLINDFSASISIKGLFQSFVLVPETLTAKDIIAVIKPKRAQGSVGQQVPARNDDLPASINLIEIWRGIEKTVQLDAISYIKKLDFPNIAFNLEEAGVDKVWQTSDSYALLTRSDAGLEFKLNLSLSTQKEKSTISFDMMQPQGKSGEAKLLIENIHPSTIVSLLPSARFLQLANVSLKDTPLKGEIVFTTNLDGTFSKGRAVLQLSGGALRAPEEALLGDHAIGVAAIDFEKRTIKVEQLDYLSGAHAGMFTGDFNFDTDKNGLLSRLGGTLWAQKILIRFSENEVFNPDKLDFDFDLDLIEERLEISKITLEADGGVGEVTGNLVYADPAVPFHLTGFIKNLSVLGVKKIWPCLIAPSVKKWISKNINEGVITSGQVELNTSIAEIRDLNKKIPLPNEAVDLTFTLENGRLRYLSRMPEIKQIKARMHLRGNSFEAKVDHGVIELPDRPIINVTNSRFYEPDFNIHGNNVNIDLILGGEVSALVELFSRPQIELNLVNFIGDYAFEGEGVVGLTLGIPISSRVSPQQRRDMTHLNVGANIQNLSILGGVQGYDVKAPFVNLAYRGDKLAVESDVSVNGVPMEVSLTERFVNLRRDLSKVSVWAELSEYDFANLKIESMAKRMRGRLPIQLELTRDRDGQIDLNLKADMKTADVRLSPLAYAKKNGQPADLSLHAKLIGDSLPASYSIESLKVVMQDKNVLLVAIAAFKDGVLEAFSLPSINLDDKGSVQISLSRFEEKRRLSFTGSYFDMSYFTKRHDFGMPVFDEANPFFTSDDFNLQKKMSANKDTLINFNQMLGKDLEVNVDIAHLQANNGVYLTDFKVEGALRDGLFENIDIKGHFQDDNLLSFGLHRENEEKRVYSMVLNKADNFLKALGSRNVRGGELVWSGQLTNEPNKGRGQLYVSQFSIPELTTLAKILTLGSLKGISDTIQNDGLYVRSAELEYLHKDSLFEIKSLVANGPALGITMKGIIDRADDRLYLDGTLVPAYSLNSLLGRIPLLGYLFTGGKGGGLLGLSYKVAGSADNPEITVNPLSLFTPGFIRNIFSVSIFGPSKPKINY